MYLSVIIWKRSIQIYIHPSADLRQKMSMIRQNIFSDISINFVHSSILVKRMLFLVVVFQLFHQIDNVYYHSMVHTAMMNTNTKTKRDPSSKKNVLMYTDRI